MSIHKPKVGVLPITYKCNARCLMCNIWKDQNQNDIGFHVLSSLFSDHLLSDNLESVNITGGEPFLRTDMVEIVDALLNKCKNLKMVTINTNGFYTQRIKEQVEKLCKLSESIRRYSLLIFISLDGMQDTHDKVRGIQGSFQNVMQTIDVLKTLSHQYDIKFSFNLTINLINYQQMEVVFELAERKGVPIDFTYSMSSPFYFQIEHMNEFDDNVKEFICNALGRLLQKPTITSKSYYRNLIQMINGEQRKVGCIFSNEGFFLHPNGNVYRCWAFNQALGNIHNHSFSEIWNSEHAEQTEADIKAQCTTCYNNCYAYYKRIDSVKKLVRQ